MSVQGIGQTLRHDPDRTSLVIREGLPENLRYTVRSRTISPSPEQLDRAFDFSIVDRKYTELPADTPPEVFEVAEEMTAGLRTPYRRALAIQNLLRTFTYDEEAPAGHGIDDLLFFLQSQRGYCEQFAGTMSVLLRALGYPARVAIGFLPGARDTSGVYHVSTEDAHAWVEMFFPDYGWLAFEPTPGRSNPVALPYVRGSADDLGGIDTGAFPEFAEPGAPIGGLDARLRALERRSDWERTVAGLDPHPEKPSPLWRRVAPVVAGGALALLGLIPLSKGWRRRRAVRRASSPRGRALAAYRVFEWRAADIGLGRRTGETLWEYAARLRSDVTFSDGHLERLVAVAGRALYSVDGVTSADARAALAAGRLVAADVRRHVGTLRTAAGAFRLRPPETGS